MLNEVIDAHITPQSLEEQWDVPGLEEAIEREFGSRLKISEWLEKDDTLHEEPLRNRILAELESAYSDKEQQVGLDIMRHFEKAVLLNILDSTWKEHLSSMDHLRQGIHLRGYAQKNPKQEYKREAFEMFQETTTRIKYDLTSLLSKVVVREQQDVEAVEAQRRRTAPVQFVHADVAAAEAMQPEASPNAADMPPPAGFAEEHKTPFVRPERKIGRNEPCPCGSGKKYKQCHGRLA